MMRQKKDMALLSLMPYVASLYWSVTIITTTGYGDITPESELEKCTSAYFTTIIGV